MANLCTLRNRRLQDMAVLMYKTKNNICPKYIVDLCYKIDTKYSLRNKDFAMPRFNTTTYGKHSIRYIGPKLWSLLPKNIRDLPSLRTVPTNYKGFCARLGPCGKSRSLQGLLESTKKNRGSHAFFRDN